MKRREAVSYGVPNAVVVDCVVAVNQDVAEGDDLRVIGNLFELHRLIALQAAFWAGPEHPPTVLAYSDPRRYPASGRQTRRRKGVSSLGSTDGVRWSALLSEPTSPSATSSMTLGSPPTCAPPKGPRR